MLALLAAAVAGLGCSSSHPYKVSELRDAGGDHSDGGAHEANPNSQFPETGIDSSTLTVTGVQPASGPFAGGNRVTVRGSGFTKDAFVYVGDHLVQPAETVLVDRNSLAVIVPAGKVGLADVRVEVGKQQVVSKDAYTYNALLLEPASGSIAGGTSVVLTLDNAGFTDGMRVEFAGNRCTDLRLITPSQLRCKTPAGDLGTADVVARWPKAAGRDALTAGDAFEYIDLADNDRGGLGGGPIDGTINITVIDSMVGMAVPKALVLLGDDIKGPHRGLTDERGQITFSGDDIHGPISVHVAVKCMERASIVGFDAKNVTVHLSPLADPSCGMDGAPPPPGRGTRGSIISGELLFPGSEEFGANGWDVVPKPRSNETRVAYVFTSRAQANLPNPSPSVEGTMARVTEDSPVGEHGYPYSIFARPAGLAVYAVSGLERRDTGEFMPYVMGVTRNVLTSPGAETAHTDIYMGITLDRELQVQLARLPRATPRGPNQFRVQANIDLGAEGVIVRQINGQSLDDVTSYTGGTLFRLFAQPALVNGLADARYQVISGWYSGDRAGGPPYTESRHLGIVQTDEPVLIDDLLPIPEVVAPLAGGHVPKDRVLRWELSDEKAVAQPDMFIVDITGGDGVPAWTQVVPGSLTASTIPDFSKVKGLADIPAGVIMWSVRAVRIEDFAYNQFKYDFLLSRFWTQTSVDTFTMER